MICFFAKNRDLFEKIEKNRKKCKNRVFGGKVCFLHNWDILWFGCLQKFAICSEKINKNRKKCKNCVFLEIFLQNTKKWENSGFYTFWCYFCGVSVLQQHKRHQKIGKILNKMRKMVYYHICDRKHWFCSINWYWSSVGPKSVKTSNLVFLLPKMDIGWCFELVVRLGTKSNFFGVYFFLPQQTVKWDWNMAKNEFLC